LVSSAVVNVSTGGTLCLHFLDIGSDVQKGRRGTYVVKSIGMVTNK
jgi:hypothetical protein